MGGYADKLRKRADEFLEAGEQLISAVRTQPRGSNLSAGIGGLAGEAVAKRQAKRGTSAGEGSGAASWPGGNTAVGLTDRRLLLFDYTAMGKPKDLVAQFPLKEIGSVELEKKKITANVLRFGFEDGSSIEVECAKLEKTADFVKAFQATKAAG